MKRNQSGIHPNPSLFFFSKNGGFPVPIPLRVLPQIRKTRKKKKPLNCKQFISLMPRKKGGGGKCYWSSLKNGKTRIVLPAPFVMDVLKHHKAVQASQKLAAGSLWDEGDFPGLVFTHPDGYHYGHVTEEMRKASSQRMQAFIDNMTGNSNDRNGAENATKT